MNRTASNPRLFLQKVPRPTRWLLVLLVAAPGLLNAQLGTVAFDARVPLAPTPFNAEGRVHLVYELRITNIATSTRAIRQLAIYGEDASVPLLTLSGAELKRSAQRVGSAVRTDDGALLEPGRQSIVHLWATLPPGAATPRRLRHRIIASAPDTVGSERADTVIGPDVAVRAESAIEISAPFAGGPWVAVNGPSNRSGHRLTALAIGGEARIPQRFASDWIKLGPDGRLAKGDSSVNANWYGYGLPVLAVSDAVVTEVLDGLIENKPFGRSAVPITLKTVGGNHVILDLGRGHFAFYAHLQTGSVKVKVGDRVRRGQVLGLLGNSGNSSGPHLHFHIGDRSADLGSEGLPFVFTEFEHLARVEGQGLRVFLEGWKSSVTPGKRSRELPLENAIVRFPR